MLAVAELLWAITLFMPGNTFARPTYAILASIAPETVWAFAFLLMGSLQTYILIKGEYHDRLAVWFASSNMTFWTFVCVSMVLSVSPFPAAISGEIALSAGAAWVFIRSGKKLGRRQQDG
jgi:hypothetical protein